MKSNRRRGPKGAAPTQSRTRARRTSSLKLERRIPRLPKGELLLDRSVACRPVRPHDELTFSFQDDDEDEDFIDDEEVPEEDRVGGYTKRTGAESDSEFDSDDEAIEDNGGEGRKGKAKAKLKKAKSKGKAKANFRRGLGEGKRFLASTKVGPSLLVSWLLR